MNPPPLCKWCNQPMQLAESIVKDGHLVSERYVCACTTPLHQLNVHHGDSTRKENA